MASLPSSSSNPSASLQRPQRLPALSPPFAFSTVPYLKHPHYPHCVDLGCSRPSWRTSLFLAQFPVTASNFNPVNNAFKRLPFRACLPRSKLDTIVKEDFVRSIPPPASISQRHSKASDSSHPRFSTETQSTPVQGASSTSPNVKGSSHRVPMEEESDHSSLTHHLRSRHGSARPNSESLQRLNKATSNGSNDGVGESSVKAESFSKKHPSLSHRGPRATNSQPILVLEDSKSLEFMAFVNKDERLWDAFVEAVQSGRIELNVNDFASVIATLTRQKKIRQALSVLRLAERGPLGEAIGKNKSPKLHTMMIDIYGKSFQLSRAFALFYGMARNGVKPNVITYNAMIAACARSNEPNLAYEVFEEMQANGLEADKFTYGALIDSFAKSGQVERAFELSQLMDSSGVPKDQTIYSALMDACGRTEQLERALMVFEEMKQKGVWPNLVTFSVLIDTCANAREPHRAFQLYSELKHWGYPTGNVIVFTSLIDACAKSGWPERAELVMQTMISQGIKPNEVSFGALVESWAQQGRLKEAFGVVERMVAEHKLLPNEVLIGCLIDACRRSRDTRRVAALWEIVVKYNLRPAKTFYPPLIAMAVMEEDDTLATAVLLHAYARGFLRRAALNSEDPTLHAIACAIVYYRHEIVIKGRIEGVSMKKKKATTRMGTVFKSIAMSDDDMDRMSSSEALKLCLAWGDNASKNSLGVRQRNGSRRDKRGVYRKDSSSSAAAKRAKDAAAAGSRRSRHGYDLTRIPSP